MSLNNEYAKLMGNGVDSLVEHHNYNKATNHVTFNAEKVELPKGITNESLQQHVSFINDTSGQVRQAVATIARTEYESNKKLTTVDGTLELGGVIFNSQHHLKQQIGEDAFLYGHSTTQTTYQHSEDHADWMAEQDKVNIEMATKLFS
jgi:hypothetical protein